MSTAEAKAAMARAYTSGEAPTLDSVSPDGMTELWKLGDALFLLPVIPPDAPPEVEYALRLRRDASLSGQCDMCGASFSVQPSEDFGTGSVSAGLFPHRGNCLAADENIFPLVTSFYEKRDKVTHSEAFEAASRRTKEKILSALPNRTEISATDGMKERFLGHLDEKLASAKGRCPHLTSNPAQTWNIFMWNDRWRCDECHLRFATDCQRQSPLAPIEDLSCDYCRRYSPTYLKPTVSRVGTFLLYGAACRRCAREFESETENVESRL